jgi:hypothetical protein
VIVRTAQKIGSPYPTALHCAALRRPAPNRVALRCAALNRVALRWTALHCAEPRNGFLCQRIMSVPDYDVNLRAWEAEQDFQHQRWMARFKVAAVLATASILARPRWMPLFITAPAFCLAKAMSY